MEAEAAAPVLSLGDCALLLLGYVGTRQGAKGVAVERKHGSFTPEGFRPSIPRSKSDTTG